MSSQTSPGSSSPGGTATTAHPRWLTWGLVVGASLISTGLAAYEIAPASVTPVIRESMGIGSTTAGLIVGVMFGSAVVASLPAGAVLDRTNSRTAMAMAVLALLIAGGWGWSAGHRGAYWSLIASRVLGGVAYVVVWNAGIDMVSRAVTASNRATAVGIFTASGPIGFALGQGTGPPIADLFGWPAIFLAFTGVALVGSVVFWPASRGLGRSEAANPSLSEFNAVLRNRSVWLIGLLGFLGYSLYLFVNSWGASYLTEEVGLSLGVSGLLVAVFPAIGVVSRISSGLLSDRVFGGRRRPVILGSFGIATPLLLTFIRLRSIPVLVAALLVAGFAIQLTLGLSFTYVREIVETRVAATAVAFHTSVGLAGAFLAPIAGGAVVELAGFSVAFLLAGVLGGCGIVLAWYAPEPARL
jgi:predicted MFS family arabinose efflux permease